MGDKRGADTTRCFMPLGLATTGVVEAGGQLAAVPCETVVGTDNVTLVLIEVTPSDIV